jgi:hypothetical protein
MPKRQGRPVKDFRPQKDRAKPKGGIPLDELLTGARRLPLLAAAQNGEYRRKLSLRGRIGPPRSAANARSASTQWSVANPLIAPTATGLTAHFAGMRFFVAERFASARRCRLIGR